MVRGGLRQLRFATFLPFLALLAACATVPATTSPIPGEWLTVPQTTPIRSVTLDADGKVTPSASERAESDGPVKLARDAAGVKLVRGELVLTESFPAIDSFDYSASRGEVVFSAMREGGFDVGLVSSDGSPISWIPADPADEIDVQWAPRGNKVSYIVRANGGDVVRTVHIPTAFELSVPFPTATIHDLAWDAAAEQYAVAYSTPDASDRVEVLRYNGQQRRTAVAPEKRLDVEMEPFAPGALLLRPRDPAYGEKLPLVVWRAEDHRWSDARAALIENARVAVVITTRPPDGALWEVARSTPWLDLSRLYVVGAAPSPQFPEGATAIIGDAAVASGRYRANGSVVVVAPAVVQSFAARFIADQLQRTTPANASSQ